MYLFLDIKYKTQILRDTVEYMMANKYGKWLGSGIANRKESILEYNMPEINDEVIVLEVRQGMRGERLKGIRRVGVSIEKNSNLDR